MTKRICIALMAAGLLIAKILPIGAAHAEDRQPFACCRTKLMIPEKSMPLNPVSANSR